MAEEKDFVVDGKFTQEFLNFWREYTGTLQGLLRLQSFRLLLDAEPIDPTMVAGDGMTAHNAGASISFIPNRVTAVLRFAGDFGEYARDQQRLYIVHELMHLVTNAGYDLVEEGLDGIDIDQTRVLMRSLYNETERVTDFLATIIAPLLPLPEWEIGREFFDTEVVPGPIGQTEAHLLEVDTEVPLG